MIPYAWIYAIAPVSIVLMLISYTEEKYYELKELFKDGGKGYKYGGRENWTVTGFPRERFTKNQLTEDFRNNFQTVLNTPGKTTIREDVYVGIGVQEQGDYVWYDIIFAHEG